MENNIDKQFEDLHTCLNEIGDALRGCYCENDSNLPNLTDVVQVALKQVLKHLNSQVTSLFLLNKDGVLTRVGMEGIDKDGNAIINDQWLPEEQYEPGESFSGRAVPPVGDDSVYGSPHYSNNLNNNYKGMKYGAEYLDKLGDLKSGISVPLNGFHRTFGTLEVFNKQGSGEFTPDDVYRLMLIGNLVANHVSHYKREYRKYVNNQLTNWLFRVESEQIDLMEINIFLATALISETTPYKVCIIREIDEQGNLINLAREGTGVSWEGRKNGNVNVNEDDTVTAQVYKSKEPFYVNDIEDAIEKELYDFHNEHWYKLNNIKSMAVLPLLARGQIVGTITASTGYKHKFSQGNKTFLKNVASLLASIIVIKGYKDQLRATEREIVEERHKLFATSRQVSYDSVMKGFLHQYKNELIEFSEVFSQLSENSNKSIKQKQQIIDGQKGWIKRRVAEISKQFRGDIDDADVVNINKSIKYVATLFVSNEPDIELSANYDEKIPEIELSEAKIKDVIYNLVNNAIAAIKRAKPKKGQLSVTTSIITLNRISYIEIIIRDNGDGISNEIQDYIFKQGFTTRGREGGTGMGLFVANEIITDYGGKISVDSKVGHGTIFKIYIPLRRYMV
jgi:hypothetical protein